jgi:hypothetical protein
MVSTTTMKKIAITGVGIIVVIAAIMFLPFRPYEYNNILNMLDVSDWYLRTKMC